MEQNSPILIRLMRGSGKAGPGLRTGKRVFKQAALMKPRPKLRLLRAFDVRFIRGPRDRSPWREAGRRYLLGYLEETERPVWNDRVTSMRQPLPEKTGRGWR
ncbi:hypothetical protein C8P63_13129 [Melghirimyces profundicolus]|uniref:Uncharacterized protein n=1 Tax=Melghirimyces profundicolus TaxID=1242148 RepID=A0A2T6B832_9BACL|nr:hypothetical protein [Melghirimyces profundicolus]PTX52213.1 hypothetical protein C8P63_13129 [Melghirimyces profundicolus]